MSLLITTLLMLINISGAARQNTPVSDSFSLIDLWLLTCTIFVALAIFEFALVVKMRYKNGEQEVYRSTRRIDKMASCFFPASFICFSAAYWIHVEFTVL